MLGFRFEWSIEQGTDIIKFASLKEAQRKSQEINKEMEFSKMQSDIQILKGLRSGTATISVRLIEPGYESVEPAVVHLIVTEPFVIIPSNTVHILPTSKY
jgi:hypothetical protein